MVDIKKKKCVRQPDYPKKSLQTVWELGRNAGRTTW